MKLGWNRKYTTIAVYSLIVILLSMVFLSVLRNLTFVGQAISAALGVLMPIIYGFAIAYLLNPLMCFFERHLARSRLGSIRARRILAITLSYLLAGVLIAMFISIVVPQLISSITMLVSNVSVYINDTNRWINNLLLSIPPEIAGGNLVGRFAQVTEELINRFFYLLADSLPLLIGITSRFTSGVISFVLGIIISIYMLSGKETFFAQTKKFLYAFLPAPAVEQMVRISHRSNQIFSGFIIGKIVDSLIIGVLCYFGMLLLDMPYAMLISLIVGVTNIIPYFGPFIGAAPGVVMLFLTEPIQALWFIILILCIQQFDGNFMSPRIVGSSIGISGVWVLFSIIVGGSLFGIPGMVAGLPTFGMIYVLVREQAHRLLKEKGRDPSDPERPYCEGESCEVEDSLTAVFGKEPPEAK